MNGATPNNQGYIGATPNIVMTNALKDNKRKIELMKVISDKELKKVAKQKVDISYETIKERIRMFISNKNIS